ncbi:MAG: DNA polymerase subunit beta [Bacillota bacterium]|nr:DNA polymerase subunit beta [Bacillota bacterium]
MPGGARGVVMDRADVQVYVRAWREAHDTERRRLAERARQGRELAARLAAMLVREYGAGEVWLFGSLARSHGFHHRSDIDLAASHLPKTEFFRILSRLNNVSDFAVDLVDLDSCPAWLARAIREEGALLAAAAPEAPSPANGR